MPLLQLHTSWSLERVQCASKQRFFPEFFMVVSLSRADPLATRILRQATKCVEGLRFITKISRETWNLSVKTSYHAMRKDPGTKIFYRIQIKTCGIHQKSAVPFAHAECWLFIGPCTSAPSNLLLLTFHALIDCLIIWLIDWSIDWRSDHSFKFFLKFKLSLISINVLKSFQMKLIWYFTRFCSVVWAPKYTY